MGPILALADDLERQAGRTLPPAAARRWVGRRQLSLAREASRVVGRAERGLRDAGPWVTLSHSSLVRELALRRSSRGTPLEMRLLRSRPGSEALDLARVLSRRGLRVRVYPDAELPAALRGASAVVLGADAIFADGTVLHKRGTFRLAGAARREGLAVHVLAGRSKFVGRRPPRRSPRPRWFDLTPPDRISVYWTDRGRWDPPTAPFRRAR